MTFPLLEAARERIRVARFFTDAEVSCAVMVRGEDFVLLRFQGTDSFEAERDAALASGYKYAGCIGVTADNRALSLIYPDLDCWAAYAAASVEFIRQQAARILAQNAAAVSGDTVSWLDKLAALPDTRTERNGGFDA